MRSHFDLVVGVGHQIGSAGAGIKSRTETVYQVCRNDPEGLVVRSCSGAKLDTVGVGRKIVRTCLNRRRISVTSC